MVAKGLKVEGIPEVTRAFDKVDAALQDLSEAHRAEANMLLPDVRSATRHGSGDLAAGWQADGIAKQAQFINDVVYSGVQEWGWEQHNIAPTHAILQAFESNDSKTEGIYADAIGVIGRKAGFDIK